jgi:hypothetical protein
MKVIVNSSQFVTSELWHKFFFPVVELVCLLLTTCHSTFMKYVTKNIAFIELLKNKTQKQKQFSCNTLYGETGLKNGRKKAKAQLS